MGDTDGGGGLSSAQAPRDWAEVIATLHNDFEAGVAGRHDEIACSLDALRNAGASGVLMSGSGAASFGIFASSEEAGRIASRLERRLGWRFLPVRTLTRMPEPRAL